MSTSDQIDESLARLKELAVKSPDAEEIKAIIESLEENIDIFRSWG